MSALKLRCHHRVKNSPSAEKSALSVLQGFVLKDCFFFQQSSGRAWACCLFALESVVLNTHDLMTGLCFLFR